MSIFPILAATAQERAVWLSFGFYVLNLLVPLIPAVIIYRLFPEGKTNNSSVEGSVGGWKIKAIGAWGAYVTAFVLGFWAINSTAVPLIRAVGGASVWTVESDLKLVDEHGRGINAAINDLVVKPSIVETWGQHVTIMLFSPTPDPPERLQVKLAGYNDETVPLKGMSAVGGKISLPAIKLTRLPPPDSSIPAPKPLPQGAGPADVASSH
ncbi:MAG: hypothetical protein ABI883_02735 [Chthoniobacterales bacterium]